MCSYYQGINMQQNTFKQFNQMREWLALQFHYLIVLVGNKVFHGQIRPENDLLAEINRQYQMAEPEKNSLRQMYYYAQNLMHSRFLLGVLGRFKSGKSTILNALAGQDISPMNTRISTGVLNFTYWNEQEECKVVYDSGASISIAPEDKIQYIDAQHNPDNEKCIHSVRHGSPTFQLQKEIIFVDTPGLDAVQEVHEKITLDFIAQCHAGIIVSTYPPFGASELQFYEKTKNTIRNIFLIQNLPPDKFQDWLELEVQTLENLHKLDFYTLDPKYNNEPVRDILQKISKTKNESKLEQFKQDHNIHLYSINAKQAYEAYLAKDNNALEKSRFLSFQRDLYAYLTQYKGAELLDNYKQKAQVVLQELINMIQYRQTLLRQSVDELEEQIQQQEKKQEDAESKIDIILTKTSLLILEKFKTLKRTLLDIELQALESDIQNSYLENNVFLLTKQEQKNIKTKISQFNRTVGQSIQAYISDIENEINQAQENIKQVIDSEQSFGKIEISSNFSNIEIVEIENANKLDKGIRWTLRGGLGYIAGSLAGGGGIALFGGGLLPILIGGSIGVALSFPLEKKLAPWIDQGKKLLGKVFYKPMENIFTEFRAKIQEELDQFEKNILDTSRISFQEQIQIATNEYFQLMQTRLQEIKEKKTNNMTHQECQQECQQLETIIEQLTKIQNTLSPQQEEKQTQEQEINTMGALFNKIFKR